MISFFDHNFDAEMNVSIHCEATTAATAISNLKEQLEIARKEGFDAGRELGMSEARTEFDETATHRFEQDRQIIQEQLARLMVQDAQQQTTTERDIVELFLGIAERLVPNLLSTFGTALAIDQIRYAVQQVRTDPSLTIRACSDVINALQTEKPGWLTIASRNAQIDLISDPQMSRGTAQVQWSGGRLEYDIEAACLTVIQLLAQAEKDYNETA